MVDWARRIAPKLIPLIAFFFAIPALFAHPGLHHDIERATEALKREPSRADLYVERAFLERLDSRLEEALADLSRARDLDPENRRVAAERGMTLSALRRDAEAEKELSRFLDTGPGTAAVLVERARVRERLGRKAAAVRDLTAALALRPDVEAYLARGALEEALGRFDAARSGYRDGMQKLGGALNLRLELIRLDTSRGRFDEALSLVEEGLASAAVKTDWYLRRAEVREAAGLRREARADRERALLEAERVLGSHATGMHLVSRAKAYLALGRTEEARQDLERAVSKSPRYAEARALLARVESTRGAP